MLINVIKLFTIFFILDDIIEEIRANNSDDNEAMKILIPIISLFDSECLKNTDNKFCNNINNVIEDMTKNVSKELKTQFKTEIKNMFKAFLQCFDRN